MTGPMTSLRRRCSHPDFAAEVDVIRLEDIGAFSADVRIRCTACSEPFAFIGMEAGLSSDGPRVGVGGLEAHLPIMPDSARLGSTGRYGFRVRAIVAGGRPGLTPTPQPKPQHPA